MKFPVPGSWLKHYVCIGGRLPFYFQFVAELPYLMVSGAVCTLKMESGTVIQANPEFLSWLRPIEAGDRVPVVKAIVEKREIAKPKSRNGGIKKSLAARAVPPPWHLGNFDAVCYPRLTGRSA